MGLTSGAGVIPLNASGDVAGPMARTVADAVAVFDVIAGTDPADTVTAAADAKRSASYTSFLVRGALRGARLGILRQAYERPTLDAEVQRVFLRTVADLRAPCAVIVDAPIDGLQVIHRPQQGSRNRLKPDL